MTGLVVQASFLFKLSFDSLVRQPQKYAHDGQRPDNH